MSASSAASSLPPAESSPSPIRAQLSSTDTPPTLLASLLHCPLCLDPYAASPRSSLPRLFPACGHNVCCGCLESEWARQEAERAHETFLCPVCSTPARVKSTEELPVNKELLEFLALVSVAGAGAFGWPWSSSNEPLAPCAVDGCPLPARWHCFTDEADLCEVHKVASHDAPLGSPAEGAGGSPHSGSGNGTRNALTRSHRLCLLADREGQRPPELCAEHHSAMLLWCMTCHTLLCHACANGVAHAQHPQSLRPLGNAASSSSAASPSSASAIAAPSSSSASATSFSATQTRLVRTLIEEQVSLASGWEKSSRTLQASLRDVDSNELTTGARVDEECDALIAAIEARRQKLKQDLSLQSDAARNEIQRRMVALSSLRSFGATIQEESTRVAGMSCFTQPPFIDPLLSRHALLLERAWDQTLEKKVVTSFPLRFAQGARAKEKLLADIAGFGKIGLPPAPRFVREKCTAAAQGQGGGIEIVWESSSSSASEQQLPHATFVLQCSPLSPSDLLASLSSSWALQWNEVFRGSDCHAIVRNLDSRRSYIFRVQRVEATGGGGAGGEASGWSEKICLSISADALSAEEQGAEKSQTPASLPVQQSAPATAQVVSRPIPTPASQSLARSSTSQPQRFTFASPSPTNLLASPPSASSSSPAPLSSPSPRSLAARRAALSVSIGPRPSASSYAPPAGVAPPSERVGWDELHVLSSILRAKDTAVLRGYFITPRSPRPPESLQLLFRMSRDGPLLEGLQRAVEGQGPVMIVVRTKVENRDYVFGCVSGLAPVAPSTPRAASPASSSAAPLAASWMFSLVSAYKRPLRFRRRKLSAHESNGAREESTWGELFLADPLTSAGNSLALSQFVVDPAPDQRAGVARFETPQEHGGVMQMSWLTGAASFAAKEVECYALNFDA